MSVQSQMISRCIHKFPSQTQQPFFQFYGRILSTSSSHHRSSIKRFVVKPLAHHSLPSDRIPPSQASNANGLTEDRATDFIIAQRQKRLQNKLSRFIDGPFNRYRKSRRFRPERIRVHQLIHPADLIRKKIPGTFHMDGAKLGAYAETLRPVILPEITAGVHSIEELLKQREENLMLCEKKSLLQHETAYVNPICMEMDRLLLSLHEIDDVLSHVISHRGVYYVHNLVTSIQLIAILSGKSTVQQLCDLDNDDRFQLLLSDLKENRQHLDHIALINVLLSLQRLGSKNYILFNAFLDPLLNMKFNSNSFRDLVEALRIVQVYRWCGYPDGLLYDHFTRALEKGRVFLTKELLVEACKLIGSVESHHIVFFKSGKWKH